MNDTQPADVNDVPFAGIPAETLLSDYQPPWCAHCGKEVESLDDLNPFGECLACEELFAEDERDDLT